MVLRSEGGRSEAQRQRRGSVDGLGVKCDVMLKPWGSSLVLDAYFHPPLRGCEVRLRMRCVLDVVSVRVT